MFRYVIFLRPKKTIEREFGVYDRIKDHYPKYVISMDEFDLSGNGIIHKNIRDFLLHFPEYLKGTKNASKIMRF